jgi:hypothetical protein
MSPHRSRPVSSGRVTAANVGHLGLALRGIDGGSHAPAAPEYSVCKPASRSQGQIDSVPEGARKGGVIEDEFGPIWYDGSAVNRAALSQVIIGQGVFVGSTPYASGMIHAGRDSDGTTNDFRRLRNGKIIRRAGCGGPRVAGGNRAAHG